MILPGQMIRMRGIFSPFCERQLHEGLSYGLSHAGYDVRLGRDVTLVQGYTVVAPILDHIDMPPDLLGMVADKSTWARRGVQVQHTVIEPGWRGTLAVELTYQPILSDEQVMRRTFLERKTNRDYISVEAGTPIAQVIVHQLMAPAEQSYRGKYQDQTANDLGVKLELDESGDHGWMTLPGHVVVKTNRQKAEEVGAKLEDLVPDKEPWWRLTDEERGKIIEKYGR